MLKQDKEENYTEARVASLVLAHDLNAWKVFVASALKETVPSDASRALIACALQHLNATAHVNLSFVIHAGKVLLSAGAHLGAMWSSVLFDVRAAVAEWHVQAGDEEEARELWNAMLPAESGVVSLRLLTNILNSALRTRSYTAAETKCLQGLALYSALSMQPEANEVVNAFLHSFASLMAARHRFVEASRRFYDLYVRTKVLSHLSVAIVSAIQADASASRTQLLATLYRDENAAQLGDLYTILTRAYCFHILRSSDLQKFLPYVQPPFDKSTVDSAFIQHNLQAISRVYYNIGLAELGAFLGVAPSEAERIVARMVLEGRLDATLDQTVEAVVFGRPDKTSALEAWNARIGAVCDELGYVVNLIDDHDAGFRGHPLLQQKWSGQTTK